MTEQDKNLKLCGAAGWSVQLNESKGLYELLNPQGKWEHPYDANGPESHCWEYAPDLFSPSGHEVVRELVLGMTDEERWRLDGRIHDLWTGTPLGFATFAASLSTPELAELVGLAKNLWT